MYFNVFKYQKMNLKTLSPMIRLTCYTTCRLVIFYVMMCNVDVSDFLETILIFYLNTKKNP